MNQLKIRLVITLVLTIAFSTQINGQNPSFAWVKTIGSSDKDRGEKIISDSSGHIYVTGRFSGTVDFEPGSGTTYLNSQGGMDIFVLKLDTSGNLLWAKSIGGYQNDYGTDIAVDKQQNVYVTGKFQGTADFDPGTGTHNISSNGSKDIFLVKLDSQGSLVWANATGGLNYDTGHGIALDDSSNIYLTGKFTGSVDFDPDTGSVILPTYGSADIFIQKLDSAGNHIWAHSFGSGNWEQGKDVAVDDSGNVIFVGSFYNTIDFNPDSALTANHSSNGDKDYYVLKLTPAGDHIWSKSFGGYYDDDVKSVITDDYGNLHLTGFFQQNVDFDPGPSTHNLSSNGQKDIFIQKLDSNGNLSWAQAFGSTYKDIGRGIHVTPDHNVLTTGYFHNTVDFDPSNTTNQETSSGNRDIFILNLDSTGTFNWVETMGGNDDDYGWAITTNKNKRIYSTGAFENVVDFDPGNSVTNKTSNGNFDIFIHKLGASITFDSIVDTACYSYTVPSGDEIYTSSGNYSDTITKSSGGKTILDIDLTVFDIDTSVINTGNVLTAVEGNANYQWVICEGFQLINGETNQSFSPSYNDAFAVIISKWNCVDTSACHTIDPTAIEDNSLNNNLKVYPNPTKEKTTIELEKTYQNIDVDIFSPYGQFIRHKNFKNKSEFELTLDQASGVYFIRITMDEARSKVIKKVVKTNE